MRVTSPAPTGGLVKLLAAVPLVAACVTEARAEVPKPLPGGHAFEVEVTETDAAGAKTQQRYVVVTGETGCGRLQASSGRSAVQLSACVVKGADAKATVDVEVVRAVDGDRTKIEGRVPLAAGQRTVVGRAESGGRKVEVSIAAA